MSLTCALQPGKIIYATNVKDRGILPEIVQIQWYETTVAFLGEDMNFLFDTTTTLCIIFFQTKKKKS